MSDGFTKLKKSGVSDEVRDDRGYAEYEKGDPGPIFNADPRLRDGSTFDWEMTEDGWTRIEKPLATWVESKANASSGLVMPKHALPGSTSLAPLAQLRPNDPVKSRTYGHDHDGMTHVEQNCPCGVKRHSKKWLERWPELGTEPAMNEVARLAHENGKMHRRDDGTLHTPLEGPHLHVEQSRYLLPEGPYGQRWDTHPHCTGDRFLAAERVFLHLEGVIKCDALVSAGELALDVPAVQMWERKPRFEDEEPALDYPEVGGFWEWYRPSSQRDDLMQFLEAFVKAPVIVVCDSDWHHNAEVATSAFCLRDWVRARGLDCAVAAPPEGEWLFDDRLGNPVYKKIGSDDYQGKDNGYPTGTPDDLRVVELKEPTALSEFQRAYKRDPGRTRSGRKRPAPSVERDLEVLHWYATHSTATGFVKRPATTIAARLGISDDSVYDATQWLHEAGALEITGQYTELTDQRFIKTPRGKNRNLGRGHKGPTPTIALRRDLRPSVVPDLTVKRWLESLS